MGRAGRVAGRYRSAGRCNHALSLLSILLAYTLASANHAHFTLYSFVSMITLQCSITETLSGLLRACKHWRFEDVQTTWGE
jgi:hypothetical protein